MLYQIYVKKVEKARNFLSRSVLSMNLRQDGDLLCEFYDPDIVYDEMGANYFEPKRPNHVNLSVSLFSLLFLMVCDR